MERLDLRLAELFRNLSPKSRVRVLRSALRRRAGERDGDGCNTIPRQEGLAGRCPKRLPPDRQGSRSAGETTSRFGHAEC